MNLLQLSKEELKQMSFIEIANFVFEEKKESLAFRELVDEVANILGLSEKEVNERISQFYTDLNVDGSFISLGDGRWGLRDWYPFDQIDEEIITIEKPKKKKKKKKVDEDDFIDELEDEDLDFDLDEEDDLDDDEEEDESLEALREEEDDFVDDEEEEILEDDEFEIEDEDLDLEEEDELEEEE